MNNKLKYLLYGGILLFTTLSFVSNDPGPDFTDNLINRFVKLWISAPQEKVYLHTDKPYYSAGEEIWLKGYLVNATTHQPNTLSKYLYVELIDKSDSVISRVKIRKDSIGFAGNIKLKPEMPSGYYTLRAYTYWMQNVSADFFFKKNIYVGNEIVDGIQCQTNFGAPEDGSVPVNLIFKNTSQTSQVSVPGKTVHIREGGSRDFKKRFTYKINAEGKIRLLLPVDSTDHSKKYIEVSIDEEGIKYSNKFYLPVLNKDFDVQFFPESGVLLTNNLQNIAFKAIGSDGLSVEVEGKIFTSGKEEVSRFSSFHKGMGKFILDPLPGESYYAIVKSEDGIEKRFNLPSSQSEGVSLHLVCYGGRIIYEVINHTQRPNKSLYMLIHSRGKVSAIYPVGALGGQISEAKLPSGINTFAIIDSLGNTLCERLLFDWVQNRPVITMESDKANYGRRELVNLNFGIHSPQGEPCAGNYSVSITDSRTVKKDTLSDNILSYLLLSSDIKGHIEDPAAYFSGNPALARENMDVLLLTQGWRRFSTADMVKGNSLKSSYYLEVGQALSGKVTNVLGKPTKNCDVIMLSGYKNGESDYINMTRITQTDSLGRYLIDGIEFPDSTTFILKAKKKKSLLDVGIEPDPDIFLPGTNLPPIPRTGQVAEAPKEYFQLSREKYYYEGGMRAVNIEEVTVVADKIKTKSQNQYYSGLADSQITSKEIDKFPGMSIMTLLSTLPGVQASGNTISIRGSANNPYILIDGFGTENLSDILYLSTSDIEEISVFKGANAAIFGFHGGDGVIAITLKSGADRNARMPQPTSLAHVVPLGYQKPTHFYVPKYEVDSVRSGAVPDLRTTIYWNPELKSDSTGTVHVQFYTADKANNYSVMVEGITNEGEICRYVGTVKRREN